MNWDLYLRLSGLMFMEFADVGRLDARAGASGCWGR